MCPLLFVRLSVRPSVCPSRICMCAPTSLSGFGSSYGNGNGYDYDYDCDSCYGPVSCHDSVSACSRPNCCMAQISAVQPPLLRSFSPSPLGCYLFAHIFFKFCHKNWFMWLPQNVCFLSHSTQTLAPTGFPALPRPRPCLDWAASLSRAGVQCVFPVHPAMFVHRMMLICQLEKRISCEIPAFPGTLKTWIHFY